MKTIAIILISVLVSLATVQAQSTPTPPAPPSPGISGSSTSSSTTSVKVNGTTNTYFSIINSDDTYKVKAKFDASKTPKIKSYLMEEFGKERMKISGSKQVWNITYDDDTAYEIKLGKGNLKILVDKELVSSDVVEKMKTVTGNIKNYISGNDGKYAEKEAKRLEREAERLMREAKRLEKQAERLAKEAKRNH